ncbi:MAG: hypothetical protein IPJ06_04685 [Saprospiraceae bacterium]|nr:hypothetical protein [Saprospiraceae bacterium]
MGRRPRSASDRLTVQPADDSWSALSSRLSKPAPENGHPYDVVRQNLVRIAAVLVLGVGMVGNITTRKAEPLTSEWITDSPVYFASYGHGTAAGRIYLWHRGHRSCRFSEELFRCTRLRGYHGEFVIIVYPPV